MVLVRVVLLTLLTQAACTSAYVPASDWEQHVAVGASFDIFPDDVRDAGGSQAVVAWTGILESMEFGEEDGAPIATFTIAHHYFDWLEDRGLQREVFFLSPIGEGKFRANWVLKREWDLKALREQTRLGGMVIAYGRPASIEDDIVDMGIAEYVRYYPAEAYRTDVLEYGRPASAVKSLKSFVF